MDVDVYYLKALKYLQIRARSEKEIRDYLHKKISNPSNPSISSMVDRIILKLKEQKFLNDEEFALMWIRSRTQFKPKGERLIRLELQKKGVTKDTINKAFVAFDRSQLQNNEEERDELSLAKELLERKRKKFEPMLRQERFIKAGSLLARRGFDLDTIKKAIEEIFEK